jgi:hypothetical protein
MVILVLRVIRGWIGDRRQSPTSVRHDGWFFGQQVRTVSDPEPIGEPPWATWFGWPETSSAPPLTGREALCDMRSASARPKDL